MFSILSGRTGKKTDKSPHAPAFHTFYFLGAAGDPDRRKLAPGLYGPLRDGRLLVKFGLTGLGHRHTSQVKRLERPRAGGQKVW